MHQVILDMDEFFRIVSSVYPKAIEDFKKAKAEAELIDDLLY